MSATVERTVQRALPARRRRLGAVALSADQLAVLAIGALLVALAVITWNRWGDLSVDTGYDLVASAKTSHADLPYLDFDYWYGPLGPLLLGGVFELTGIVVWGSVALGLVLAAAVVGLSYALARLLVDPLPAALAAALTAVPALSSTNISYVQPHTLDAPLGMILAVVALLAAVRFASSGRRAWLAGGGLCLGLAALTKPESVGALALALGGWLVVRAVVAAPGDRRRALADTAVVGLPALAVTVCGYGAFFLVGAVHHPLTLGELVHEDLFPKGLLRESVSVVYGVLAPRTPASFAALGGKLALYAAAMTALTAAGMAVARLRAWRLVAGAAIAVALVGVAVGGAARPDSLRYYVKFAFAWMPAGAALAAAALAWQAVRRRQGGWTPTAQAQLLVALLLVGFSYSAYARFAPYPNPDYQQGTAYAMPVMGAFLAWLHVRVVPRAVPRAEAVLRVAGAGWLAVLTIACLALLVHDARQETTMVRGPHGAMAARPAEGTAYQQALDVIARTTRRSEPILLAPQMTALYVMAGRTDVLPQLSLLPGALDGPAQERAAIERMDQSGLRLAIVDRTPLARYGRGSFGVGYDRLIGAWLRRDFTHISTLRGSAGGGDHPRTLDVWLRRTQ